MLSSGAQLLRRWTARPRTRARARSTPVCLLAVVLISLGSASIATAAVIRVTPDLAPGSNHLATAIALANANGSPSNTIVLAPGAYTPGDPLPEITKRLTITGDHAAQATGGTPSTYVTGAGESAYAYSGYGVGPGLFTVSSRANLTLEAFQIEHATGAAIYDLGHVTTWGVTLADNNGPAVFTTGSRALVNLSESTIDGSIGSAGLTVANGRVNLVDSDVVSNALGGVSVQAGQVSARNTLVADNHGPDCSGARLTGSDDMDDDGTCHVRFSDVGYWRTDGNFPTLATNGGPTETALMPVGSPTIDAGRWCPTTDQRFFANPIASSTIEGTARLAADTRPPV